jgi:adenosylcobinamide-phosphate synthase
MDFLCQHTCWNFGYYISNQFCSEARRDRHNHPSPNSGHPEAAAAGALGVRLGGASSYGGVPSWKEYIGEPHNLPDEQAYHRMIRLMYISTMLMAAACMIAAFCLRGFRVPFV